MGKSPDSSSRLRHDVDVIRKAIAADAAALKGEEKTSGHVVMNWIQVGLLVGSMLVTVVSSSAVAWYQLNQVQSTVDRTEGLVSSLGDRVLSLEKDGESDSRDRARLEKSVSDLEWKMQNQEKYVSKLKGQMELLWVAGGFPEMKGGE